MALEPALEVELEPALEVELESALAMAWEPVPAVAMDPWSEWGPHGPVPHGLRAAPVSEWRLDAEAEQGSLPVVPVSIPQLPAASVAEAQPDTEAAV